MSEATLRASTNVLAGTSNNDWPMVAHSSGVGAIPNLVAPWDARNMQYVGVLLVTGGEFDTRLMLTDVGGADITPLNMRAYRDDLVLDGKGYVSLVNPAGATPPAIPQGNGITFRAFPYNGPWPAADWEVGIFERIPYDPPPPPPPGPGALGPCPERPPWPYLPPSITGYQGPIGVTRGARR